MAWLDDNPPRTQQFRCPRRRRPSGIIGVHTAESIGDEIGPDTGAENVARFIRDRSNYGSYHLLADSDSIIHLVRFECVAYHIGTHSLNEHTIGISAAAQAARWNDYGDAWVIATVRNMARAAARAARWLKRHYGIEVPARRITLAQALAGQRGFLAHGDADPERRTDPGRLFPWGLFLDNYADEMREDDDDMTPAELLVTKVPLTKGMQAWFGTGVTELSVAGLLGYAGAGAWKSVQLLLAAQPLLAAAAGGRSLTAEEVAQIAEAIREAAAEDFAEDVVDELAERIAAGGATG